MKPTPLTTGFASTMDAIKREQRSRQIQEQPSMLLVLANPELRGRVVAAVIKSLGLNLLLTAAVLLPGILLVPVSHLLGVVWLFLGAFFLMGRTYAKPWRLTTFSCLSPVVVSLISWSIQLWLFRDAAPSGFWVLMAAAVGTIVGYARARTHHVYVEDGTAMAKRTVGYIAVWAAAYVITQALAMVGTSMFVRAGLLTIAFSTFMMISVSISLLSKYRTLRDAVPAT